MQQIQADQECLGLCGLSWPTEQSGQAPRRRRHRNHTCSQRLPNDLGFLSPSLSHFLCVCSLSLFCPQSVQTLVKGQFFVLSLLTLIMIDVIHPHSITYHPQSDGIQMCTSIWTPSLSSGYGPSTISSISLPRLPRISQVNNSKIESTSPPCQACSSFST